MTKETLTHEAYIGLGSNLDDRENYLSQAIASLHQHPACEVVCCSHVYETAPVGFVDQPHFLNMVVRLHTQLSPEALLKQMLYIEQQLGRVRDIRYGPRTIDLDLLLYDQVESNSPTLILPHPRMMERLFVLVPLMDCASEYTSEYMASLRQNLHELEEEGGVQLWKKTNWQDGSVLFEN